MRFLSLFAGIGGFDLGLERAGMECVGQVEIDPFCQAVLAHHWPNVKRIGDIRNVTAETFAGCGAVDLICGGFPCQPFSTAGKRGGRDDDRYLWPEMLRVIGLYKPRWVIGENVRGLLSIEQGVVFDQVLADLENIGYEVQAYVVPACSLDAPHRRDRIWIIGARRDVAYTGYRSGRDIGAFTTRNDSSTIVRSTDNSEIGRSSQGESGDVAHSKHDGCAGASISGGPAETIRGQSSRESRAFDSAGTGGISKSHEDVADSNSTRLHGCAETGNIGGCRAQCNEQSSGCSGTQAGSNRQPERGLGGVADGLPAWLDGRSVWPSEPQDIPRVTTGQVNRTHRLKALGNAVVPQIVEQIGLAIVRVEESL